MEKLLNRFKSFYAPNLLWGAIVAVGIILRLRQYLANRSLWVDEAGLALNIVNRTFGGLTLPLDYNQGAPIGFLFIEKLIILVLGNHDYILRLFPILSGVLSVCLMYLVASEHFGKSGLFAALLFSISASMVYFSSELKQYSSDVMFALLLTYLGTLCLKQEQAARNFILLGLVGIFSIWVSHPAAFILAGIGLLLLVEKLCQKAYSQVTWTLGVGAVWGLTFLMTYIVSLRHLIDNQFLKDYWQSHYMPLPPWAYPDWYKVVFTSLLTNISPNFGKAYLIWGCFVLILIGIASLFLRNWKIALLVTSPFLMASVASAMQRYPLSGRFMHFLFPFVALLIAEGLGRIYSISIKLNRQVAIFVYGALVIVILWMPTTTALQNVLRPPMGEDIKPVLAYIQSNVRENDTIYVHSGSVPPFKYYSSFYELKTDNILVPEKSGSVKRFLTDVEDLKGRTRVWFIFSHVTGCDNCQGDELEYHIQLLDKHGIQQDSFRASGAAGYLYDLNP